MNQYDVVEICATHVSMYTSAFVRDGRAQCVRKMTHNDDAVRSAGFECKGNGCRLPSLPYTTPAFRSTPASSNTAALCFNQHALSLLLTLVWRLK